jgi:arabinogalactan oligomer / maltooligosaccharide transport system substrate-binding protein
MRKLALVAFALAALGPRGAAAADLVVWHAYRGAEKAAFEKVVAAYNAKGGGNKVTTLAVPYDAFADKISAAVPRGKGPDVFIYAQDRLGGWIEAGNTVEPIDFYVDDAIKGRYVPATLEAMTYRGSVWGLPLNYKCIALVYNRKLVKDPPQTTADLEAVATKLTDRAAGKFGLAYSYGDFYYHAALQNGLGGRVFDGGKPVLANPENVKAAKLLQDWIKAGFLPAEPSSALITSLFNEGKAAMVFSGNWFLGEIASGVDYAVATLPAITEAGGKPMRPWITVEGAYIAAPSKSKEAAFDFVKYLTDVEAAKVMALEGRQSPAAVKVYAEPQVAADPVLTAFKKQVDVAVPMPNLPEMTMVWSPATTAMGSIIRGGDPKAALSKAQEKVAADVASLHKSK